jgi:anti-sigma factor RsiW
MSTSVFEQDCPSESELSDAVFGRLDASRQSAVDEHLLGCEPCAGWAETELSFVRLFREIRKASPSQRNSLKCHLVIAT